MALIPLTSGAYSSQSVIANAQRCVNLYPEINPKSTTPPVPVTHYPTPGLVRIGGPALPPEPPVELGFLAVVGDVESDGEPISSFVETSSDALTWNNIDPSLSSRAGGNDITSDGVDTFVVVGTSLDTGPVLSLSIDGALTFVAQTTGLSTDCALETVAYGAGKFLAGGANFLFSSGVGVLITSLNGVVWTSKTTPFADAGAQQGFIVGSHYSTFDTKYLIGGTLRSGNGGISTSSDSDTWSANKPNGFTLNGFNFGDVSGFANNGAGVIIAVGQKGTVAGFDAHVEKSMDGGDTWVAKSFADFDGNPNAWANAVTFGNDMFLACGYKDDLPHLEMSVDLGETWSVVDVSDIFTNSNEIADVNWSEGLSLFVMSGHNIVDGVQLPLIATSPTGLAGTWTVPTVPFPPIEDTSGEAAAIYAR